ncbi:hypothetical protein [Georhizobium profundi]|uniref:hypothetical protein n=1 Tax=Georhizobium profundi TaxID=2341112 RepID=UPI0013DEFD2B|nr:hypothetical protein [Georhizobium profundi]
MGFWHGLRVLMQPLPTAKPAHMELRLSGLVPVPHIVWAWQPKSAAKEDDRDA